MLIAHDSLEILEFQEKKIRQNPQNIVISTDEKEIRSIIDDCVHFLIKMGFDKCIV